MPVAVAKGSEHADENVAIHHATSVDAVRCENKDGVLTVHIPKTETEKRKPKQIRVD